MNLSFINARLVSWKEQLNCDFQRHAMSAVKEQRQPRQLTSARIDVTQPTSNVNRQSPTTEKFCSRF